MANPIGLYSSGPATPQFSAGLLIEMEAEGSGPAGVAAPLEPSTLLPPEVNEILAKARSSWLKNNEVLELLQGYQDLGLFISSEAPLHPTGLWIPGCWAGSLAGWIAVHGCQCLCILRGKLVSTL